MTKSMNPENANLPATKKQLWALYCATKVDHRGMNLTRQEASDKLSSINGARSSNPKKDNVIHIDIYTKERKRFGTVYPSEKTPYAATVIPGKSITIVRYDNNGEVYMENHFHIGDEAEYDSFNLQYTGEIVKITEKAVTITNHGRNYRLDLHKFAWRNIDFDAEEVAKKNAETMMYI